MMSALLTVLESPTFWAMMGVVAAGVASVCVQIRELAKQVQNLNTSERVIAQQITDAISRIDRDADRALNRVDGLDIRVTAVEREVDVIKVRVGP